MHIVHPGLVLRHAESLKLRPSCRNKSLPLIALKNNDLSPDLVIDLLPLLQHFIYMILRGGKEQLFGELETQLETIYEL